MWMSQILKSCFRMLWRNNILIDSLVILTIRYSLIAGVAPPSFVFIQAGKTLHKMASTDSPWSWSSVALLAVFAVLSLLPVIFKKKLQKKLDWLMYGHEKDHAPQSISNTWSSCAQYWTTTNVWRVQFSAIVFSTFFSLVRFWCYRVYHRLLLWLPCCRSLSLRFFFVSF